MTTDQLANVARSLRAVSGAMGEYERQRAQGTKPNSATLISTLARESTRLHFNGCEPLAEAMRTLQDEVEAMQNG